MLPRISLAVLAAVVFHAALIAGGQLGPGAASPASAAGSMKVRFIALEARPVVLAPTSPEAAGPQVADALVPIQPSAHDAKIEARGTGSATPVAERARGPTEATAAVTPVAETRSEGNDRVAALPAAPSYLLGAVLDPGPQPIGNIEPEYPESAHLQEGTVVIRVLISEAGHVDNVAVVRSDPKGLFEDAAIEAFGKAHFTPARAAGIPVKSQITVEVHFLPINRGSRISGRGY